MFEIDARIRGTELFLKLLARNELRRTLQQYLQNGEQLTLQSHANSLLAQFAGKLSKLVGAKSYDVGSRWAGHGCGSPRLAQVYLCSFGFRQGYHLSPEILLHQ